MKNKVLIAGGGQLGSRYLQGLAKYGSSLQIYVYDISNNSLDLCKKRWIESQPLSHHSVFYINELSLLPKTLDLAIVSTTADVRLSVILDIKAKTKVDNWILEKILAQSINELDSLRNELIENNSVWVNTPMFIYPLYRQIKDHSPNRQRIIANFKGFNGLACNSIHYIDLINRWNNSRITEVKTNRLNKSWHPSPRSKFEEIYGEIKVFYEDKSVLTLSKELKDKDFLIKIKIGDLVWDVSEKKRLATNNLGKRICAGTLMQSEMTSDLIYKIFNGLDTFLPTLEQSYYQHKFYLNSLIKHKNLFSNEIYNHVQIT